MCEVLQSTGTVASETPDDQQPSATILSTDGGRGIHALSNMDFRDIFHVNWLRVN